MTVFDNIMDGISFAKEKITDAAHCVADKNRKSAQLNRLKSVMKRENETMAKAYQALGKLYYEKMTDEEREENKFFCQILEKSGSRMEKAHIRYVEIMNGKQNDEVNEEMSQEDFDDITVACSNESKYEKTEEPEENGDNAEEDKAHDDKPAEDNQEEISEAAEEDLF
ncbi:MAG: hypothetical protein ACI4HL_01155 [Ruminococcus sp.]